MAVIDVKSYKEHRRNVLENWHLLSTCCRLGLHCIQGLCMHISIVLHVTLKVFNFTLYFYFIDEETEA